jgi:hypothetical protein
MGGDISIATVGDFLDTLIDTLASIFEKLLERRSCLPL